MTDAIVSAAVFFFFVGGRVGGTSSSRKDDEDDSPATRSSVSFSSSFSSSDVVERTTGSAGSRSILRGDGDNDEEEYQEDRATFADYFLDWFFCLCLFVQFGAASYFRDASSSSASSDEHVVDWTTVNRGVILFCVAAGILAACRK